MAGITLDIARKHLKAWLTAELEITTNQSYQIGSRMLTKANLREVRKEVEFWENQIKRLENIKKYGGRNRVYRCVPRDI